MNPEPPLPPEEAFVSFLAACDDALAAGAPLPDSALEASSPELRQQLDKRWLKSLGYVPRHRPLFPGTAAIRTTVCPAHPPALVGHALTCRIVAGPLSVRKCVPYKIIQ